MSVETHIQVLPAPPAEAEQRLPALDFLRGIAILAILPANMPFFSGTVNHWTQEMRPGTVLDQAVLALAMFFVFGKFISLLSILFGAGLAIQADKARVAGKPFAGYYAWRMALLFILGIAHALFLWYGDILASYALVGLAVIAVSLLGQRGVLWFAFGCLVWTTGFTLFNSLSLLAGGGVSPFAPGGALDPAQPDFAHSPAMQEVLRKLLRYFSDENQTAIYGSANPLWMIVDRSLLLLNYIVGFWLGAGWYILACFLIGVYLKRRGVFHDPETHRPLVLQMILIGLAVGLPFQAIGVAPFLFTGNAMFPLALLYSIGALPLTLAYLGLGLLWTQRFPTGWLQTALQATGRLALSNYLLQSVLCNFIFYGYGLGLYGQLGYAACFGVTLLIWLIEIGGSVLWLRFFQMGPIEWVWRSLADGKARPFLRAG